MAQLNFYVPDILEKSIRQAAQKKGEKVSAYLASLVKEKLAPRGWKKNFFTKIVGGWQENFPEIERLPCNDDEFE
ncbi:MAG: hypothetical protein A3G32_00280 [Deltaproteobacteria bacterium RIFCSPLOWO2_12_FULL_40_28]|nr:MAG: hypothetical protein A3C45_03435 [Deltaproteobacteria bacterium RIFCSPHIGHO2_02_FULL_40_28]OGQ19160.1 MAG: hypothetical protein A3E27_02320 [Deltaproteobacteria bacterium RIFCSPHIGHO2_12_FULL_40_32]OGQ39776.1 MAG: hypothetical protein A3I69_07395 [Deltaproteobacteria bacterium RIFCSPLOWO2_02_FULL_40_36]OGQ53612.1 MAG: hypothetical protein A3G32_00280 [Deltaproteobacteria bacterium RIFCSPLOWO2_12_FULL_40_28]